MTIILNSNEIFCLSQDEPCSRPVVWNYEENTITPLQHKILYNKNLSILLRKKGGGHGDLVSIIMATGLKAVEHSVVEFLVPRLTPPSRCFSLCLVLQFVPNVSHYRVCESYYTVTNQTLWPCQLRKPSDWLPEGKPTSVYAHPLRRLR